MGLLDDAIREHLELKRRRGADPAEVARQEHEALGPVRPVPTSPASEPQDGADAAADEPIAEDSPAPAEAANEAEPERPGLDPDLEADFAFERPGGSASMDDAPAPAGVAPDEQDVVPADEEPAEDVLEETPEFLQETPEHDRLWFEQRPPRDFDFGGS